MLTILNLVAFSILWFYKDFVTKKRNNYFALEIEKSGPIVCCSLDDSVHLYWISPLHVKMFPAGNKFFNMHND